LWEIGALNLLIAPLHIPLLPRKFRVVVERALVLLVLREGKGRKEALGRKGKGAMVQGLVLVHDMEETRKKDLLREEASKFGASDAPLTVDAHQYVALAHGPDVEEAVGEEEESNSSSCWIRRSFVSEDHEESSVATELPYSSSHLWKFGKNAGRLKLFALLVLCLLAALALVGLRSSVVVWEKEAEEEEAPGIFSVARNETASRAATTGDVVVPYPTRRTAFHVRPPKNWISGECENFFFFFFFFVLFGVLQTLTLVSLV